MDPASRQASPAAEPSHAVVDSIAGGALRVQDDDDAGICERLFKGLVFFLGREVPREQLLFVVRAFGGVVAWQGEGSPLPESDDSITHQVGPPCIHKQCPYTGQSCLSSHDQMEMDAEPARNQGELPVCFAKHWVEALLHSSLLLDPCCGLKTK